jgi:SAM-dependent methyltransferase
MHRETFAIMEHLVHTCLSPEQPLCVLDVGSGDINGAYRPLFDRPRWCYAGADIAPGPNVDIVLADPYRWEIPDASYDLVITGQAFEHIEFFWLTWLEMVRTVRHGGLLFLVAPSGGREHRWPVDCWRFYRDGMHALARYAGVDVLAADTYWETFLGRHSGRLS